MHFLFANTTKYYILYLIVNQKSHLGNVNIRINIGSSKLKTSTSSTHYTK